MDRRDFFSTAGYSLIVLADQIPAAAQSPGIAEIHKTFTRPNFSRIVPASGANAIPAEPHLTRVDLKTDLLVAGGGLAGVCTAISAARHGSKVILLQDRSRLGGNSSSEVKMHVVGASCHKGRPGWRESGLLEELRLEDAVNNPQRCWEMWDLLLYDKVISEPNIALLLDTTLFRTITKNNRITEVWARSDRTEHLYRIEAPLFVDATGDSRLGLESGAEIRWGREARSEFQETLAPEKADGETLGSSILFTSRLYPRKMPFKPPVWARKVTKEHLHKRNTDSWEYGYWWIEWGGDKNPIRDNEQIRFELLSIVLGVWDYIKNSGDHPNSEFYALDWVGMMPGKRGSRRMVGDHVLTEHDLTKSVSFEDAVAIGGWPLDDHPPGGFDRADLPPNTSIKTKDVFSIPLRSLYSKNIENLFMAGRNISASHVAFTSTRVMATCAVIGQAVGTAASLCRDHDLSPRALYQNKSKLQKLQQTLLRDDQSISGVSNQDRSDLARTASIKTSSESDSAPARNIVDGHLRDIPNGALHHWEAPSTKDGQWIDLSWDQPKKLKEIQLTFDSGFQRELTLTSSDTVNRGIIRAPQPETVKDYKLYYRESATGDWKLLCTKEGNYQRQVRHRFPEFSAQAIRMHATATNGSDTIRVFEIRCYS